MYDYLIAGGGRAAVAAVEGIRELDQSGSILVVGAEAHLPWAGDPTHTPGALDNGYLADAERFRVRMRIGADF